MFCSLRTTRLANAKFWDSTAGSSLCMLLQSKKRARVVLHCYFTANLIDELTKRVTTTGSTRSTLSAGPTTNLGRLKLSPLIYLLSAGQIPLYKSQRAGFFNKKGSPVVKEAWSASGKPQDCSATCQTCFWFSTIQAWTSQQPLRKFRWCRYYVHLMRSLLCLSHAASQARDAYWTAASPGSYTSPTMSCQAPTKASAWRLGDMSSMNFMQLKEPKNNFAFRVVASH